MSVSPTTERSAHRGCWTCRARRKRCDFQRPLCGVCDRLGITCAGYDSTKPLWMDGGDGQRDYCRSLTAVIKRNRRQGSRGSEYLMSPTRNVAPSLLGAGDIDDRTMFDDYFAASVLEDPFVNDLSAFEFPTVDIIGGSFDSGFQFSSPELHFVTLDDAKEAGNEAQGPIAMSETDRTLLMHYFDHTFYHLFPLDCQLSAGMDRGWLLSLALHSPLVKSTFLTSSLWYQSWHSGDKAWQESYEKALEDHEANFQELFNGQIDSFAEFGDKVAEALVCQAHLMVIQSSHDNTERVTSMLENGRKLLRIVEDYYSIQHAHPSILQTINTLQSWLYQALVLSSTTSPTSSSLTNLDLLPPSPTSTCSSSPISTVLTAILKIQNLSNWKHTSLQTSSLSMMDLVTHAKTISSTLTPLPLPPPPTTPHPCTYRCHTRPQSEAPSPVCPWHTWLTTAIRTAFIHAALIYLHTVVSGCNPKLPEIQSNVTKAFTVFKMIVGEGGGERCLGAPLLRCMAWPVGLAGSLLGRETGEEVETRIWLAATLVGVKQLSGLLSVIKGAWRALDSPDGEGWELGEMGLFL